MSTKVTQMLKKYPSQKCAVRSYERNRPYPSAGIANYDAMPSGSGAPERFFVNAGRMADMGMTTDKDRADYERYKATCDDIEMALESLTEDEQSVIKLKWFHGVDLKDITKRKPFSYPTVKRLHKSALTKLEDALRFTNDEDIEIFVLHVS